MAIARAVVASIHAGPAQIIVSIVADVAVIVLVRHRRVTVVAIDGPSTSWRRCRFDLWTNSKITLSKWLYHVVTAAGPERAAICRQLGGGGGRRNVQRNGARRAGELDRPVGRRREAKRRQDLRGGEHVAYAVNISQRDLRCQGGVVVG